MRRGQCPKLSYVAKASRFGFGFGVASLLDLQINLFNSHSTWTPQREIFYNADTRWAPTQRGVKVHNTERRAEGEEGELGTVNKRLGTGSMAIGRLKRAWDLPSGATQPD